MGGRNIKNRIKTLVLKKNCGFSLTEVIIVVVILAILIIMAMLGLKPWTQISKANDGVRKSDLKRISLSLDEYIDDNPCYPLDIYDGSLSSYLNQVPVDPKTKSQYIYERISCNKYVIYATLAISQGLPAYGHDLYTGNYIVTSSNVNPSSLLRVEEGDSIRYGCNGAVCQLILNWLPFDRGINCQPVYGNSTCDNMCGDIINIYNCSWQF